MQQSTTKLGQCRAPPSDDSLFDDRVGIAGPTNLSRLWRNMSLAWTTNESEPNLDTHTADNFRFNENLNPSLWKLQIAMGSVGVGDLKRMMMTTNGQIECCNVFPKVLLFCQLMSLYLSECSYNTYQYSIYWLSNRLPFKNIHSTWCIFTGREQRIPGL